MKAKGAISIALFNTRRSTSSPGIISYKASYKGLRYGSIFSFMSPGKKPNRSPASTAGLDKINLLILP